MQDQGDNCRAHAVENRRYQLQIPEVDVESAQSGDDHKIWKNKRPTAGPGAPEACPQVGNIDADLDCEWTRQRLTNRDRLAHLVFVEPLAIRDQLALHLSDQRDRSAKSEQSKAKKIEHHLSHVSFFFCGDRCHVRFLLGELLSIIDPQVFHWDNRTGSLILAGKGRAFSNMPTSGMTNKKNRK